MSYEPQLFYIRCRIAYLSVWVQSRMLRLLVYVSFLEQSMTEGHKPLTDPGFWFTWNTSAQCARQVRIIQRHCPKAPILYSNISNFS